MTAIVYVFKIIFNYSNKYIRCSFFVFCILREIFDHVRGLISKHGSDCWWNMSVEELLPQEILSRVRIPLTIHVVQYTVN